MFKTEIVQLNLSENNEKRFGLPKQPAPACPMIDKIVSDLVDKDLSTVFEDLEALRSHIKSIRAWGQAWKELYLREL